MPNLDRYLGLLMRRLVNRLRRREEGRVEKLLLQFSPSRVRRILEKRAATHKAGRLEDLAYFYLMCGNPREARHLLEARGLRKSPVYVRAVIAEDKIITGEIDAQIKHHGKIPRKTALLLAGAVRTPEEKNRLKAAVLTAPSIVEEKSLLRLLIIGQASRCAGDYSDALTAYRTAFHRARQLYSVPGEESQKGAANKEFSIEKAWKALRDFRDLALPGWFIDAGTLLGFIREGAFLQHDYDLDLGIIDAAVFQETKKKLFNSPLFVFKPQRVAEVMKVRHVNGIDIDIFLYRKAGHSMYKESHVYRWDFPCFILEMRKFGLEPLPVPSPPERHLEASYGGDWQVPQSEFDGRYDAYNISFPNLDELECVLLNKSIRALKRGNKKHLEKELRMLQRIGREVALSR